MSGLPRARIGVPIISDAGWMGGVQYVIHLVTALARLPEAERPDIVLVLRPELANALQLHAEILPFVSEIVVWGVGDKRLERPGVRVIPTMEGLFERIDLLIPGHVMVASGMPIASWIPDFQQNVLPELFTSQDRDARDAIFRCIGSQAELLMLSSHAARRDWERFYPGAKPTVRVVPFRGALEPSWLDTNPEEVAAKHGVREPFLICCNQFWSHKGHDTLVRALGAMRREGVTPRLVCTGATTDYRSHTFFDELRALMAAEGLSDQIRLLGLVPRAEQIALIRRSLAVVQPSRFEGWSTVVEDARLLGKTIVMSDIDVHVEQAPRHGHYFRVGDAADLAATLCALLPSLTPGPHVDHEEVARHEADELLLDYGRRVVALSREMPSILAGNAQRSAMPLIESVSEQPPADSARPMSHVLEGLRKHVAAGRKP